MKAPLNTIIILKKTYLYIFLFHFIQKYYLFLQIFFEIPKIGACKMFKFLIFFLFRKKNKL